MNSGTWIVISGIAGFTLGILFLVLIVGRLLVQVINRDKMLIPRSGKYEIRCGGRFGNIYVTFPIVKFSISSQEINIRYFSNSIVITNDAEELKINSDKYHIVFTRIPPQKPVKIEIWSPYASQIANIAAQFGYSPHS